MRATFHTAIGTVGSLLLLLILVSTFQNCAGPNQISPQDMNQSSNKNPNLPAAALALALAPASRTVAPSGIVAFDATGGKPPYTFSTVGGGSILQDSGIFTAGSNAGSVQVYVTDMDGKQASSLITVAIGMTASYSPSTIHVGEQVTVTASGGTPPYTYTVKQGAGVMASNVYNASSTPEPVEIEVRDNAQAVVKLTFTTLALPVEPNVTVDLSTMTIDNSGISVGPSGLSFFSNGHVFKTVNFPSGNGVYEIQLSAKGDLVFSGVIKPNLRISIDGVVVGNIKVSSWSWTNYSISGIQSTAGNHVLDLAFTNDVYYSQNSDLNVYVQSLVLSVGH